MNLITLNAMTSQTLWLPLGPLYENQQPLEVKIQPLARTQDLELMLPTEHSLLFTTSFPVTHSDNCSDL